MKNLYLNTKQILYLLVPLLIALYLFFNPLEGVALVDSSLSLLNKAQEEGTNKKSIKDSIKGGYHDSLEAMKENKTTYKNSLSDTNKPLALWTIAYIYKDVIVAVAKPTTSAPKGKLGKLAKMQAMVDQRNRSIDKISGKIEKDSDYKTIMDIINSRGLKKRVKKTTAVKKKIVKKKPEINLDVYNLQMILYSGNDSKVIINDKIIGKNKKIDKDTRVVKIKKDKVLIQRDKEKKWLHLIK